MAIGVVAALIALTVSRTPVYELENSFRDLWIVLRGERVSRATDQIVIIDINAASLAKLKKPAIMITPELAKVCKYLDQQGASAIGIDFFIPSEANDYEVFERGADGELREFGKASADLGVTIDKITADQKPGVTLPLVISKGAPHRPLFAWEPAAPRFGVVNLSPGDPIIRRTFVEVRHSEGVSPSFAESVFSGGDPHNSELILLAAHEPFARTPLRSTTRSRPPIDQDGCTRINFVGPPGTIKQIPLLDILNALDVRDDMWRDKYVLIGSTKEFSDQMMTPWANSRAPQLMSGIEVHANMLATLLDEAFIDDTPWFVDVVAVILTGPVLGILLMYRRRWETAIYLTITAAAWLGLSFLACYMVWPWHVNVIPMGVMILILPVLGFLVYVLSLRRVLRQVTDAPIARVLEHPDEKLQRGDRRVITVLFVDIQGFTRFAERTENPTDIVELLNDFFGVVVPIIEKYLGAIDKFTGDGLSALFNAPIETPHHAEAGARAAAEIIRDVDKENDRWKRRKFPELVVRVGVNTGAAVVGMVGNRKRSSFTAHGDAVNTAAHIERANRDKVGSNNGRSGALIGSTTFGMMPADIAKKLGYDDTPLEVVLGEKKDAPIKVHRLIRTDSLELENPRPPGGGN